jgi:ubiquinone/menaquinone biosynthesis C-methylase UbiE
MEFYNVYEDAKRAESYAKLEFPATYYLAYRDLPAIIAEHVSGKTALDFGCGAGRSTRFLQRIGFNACGVDISGGMIKKAREIDAEGDYRLIDDGDLSQFRDHSFDLILSAFTFDNIPTKDKKVKMFGELGRLLKAGGKIVSLVSSPDIYKYEWASFSTKDFPENKNAKSGDTVKIIMTDVEDKRPVDDIIWYDEEYREVYRRAGLELLETYRPLAKESEPYRWVNETKIAPWVIYVLQRHGESGCR